MGVMLLTVVIDVLPKLGGVLLMFVCWELSPLKDVVSRAPQWWVLLFFLDDLTYYSFHRANHEVRFLWAGHVSHHNSQYYNYGTALRQGVGERVIKYLFWCPLALLGFDPVMIITMMSLSLIYQFWLHTETIDRMPAWFEWLFQYPEPSSRSPRLKRQISGSQSRRRADYLGSPIRHLQPRSRC